MSATTPAAKANKFHAADSAVALAPWASGIILIGLATLIGFNAGEFTLSFWLGVIIPASIGIAVFLLWVSHSMAHTMTKKWPGLTLGIVVFIVTLTVIPLLLVLPGDSLQFDKFGWGLLVMVILAAQYTLIKLYGWISRYLKSKHNPK